MKNLSCELVFFILLTFGTLRAIGFCLVPFGRKQDWKEDHECNESKKRDPASSLQADVWFKGSVYDRESVIRKSENAIAQKKRDKNIAGNLVLLFFFTIFAGTMTCECMPTSNNS